MHSLVLRQLRKSNLAEDSDRPDLTKFLELVSAAYVDAEEDRRLLEHSLNLASEEVYERNRQLEREIEQRTILRQRLDHTTRHAEDNERKYQALFELSPVGIIAADLQSGRILQINDAMVSLTGFSRDVLRDMRYSDIAPFDVHALTDAADGADRQAQFGPNETQFERRDGSRFPAMVSGIRTSEHGGGIVVWSIVQDISQRKAFELELADAARRDKLTGLANRLFFMERLEQAIERVRRGTQESYAVLFLDFDRFKLVNDTLGHEAGDELLRQIAQRLRQGVQAQQRIADEGCDDIVSRFGGDEFLILLNGRMSPEGANSMAEVLLRTLTPSYQIRGRVVHSSASIGIITSSQGEHSAEDVVRNADLAMYEAKRGGRARAVIFNEEMHTRLARAVLIETSLRNAIGTDELKVHYQPIISLASRKLVSAEALLRWIHPTLGNVTPSEFIPIAEDSGLIVSIGQWVQREACRAFAQWREQDWERAPATISVNVSRAELALGNGLLEQIRGLLVDANLPPECLQLEITEREFMRHQDTATELLSQLRGLGVKIAMDDFGTGMSSLGFLRSSPFDVIKIDRSFLEDLSDSPGGFAVIHAAVNLIENLGMTSVAEGVEDAAQVAILQALGCRYAQGYLFSKAVVADKLLDAANGPLIAPSASTISLVDC